MKGWRGRAADVFAEQGASAAKMKSAPGPGALDSYLASDPFTEKRVDESPRTLPFIDEFVVRKSLNRLLDRAGAGNSDAFKKTR